MKRLLRAAKRKMRGFTLVELMIAMLGGLFVALAVVALSKQATNTVFEEARTATAEMSVRVAIDRLRADLSRAGYMSTGNIHLDPKIMEPRADLGDGIINLNWSLPGNGTAPAGLAQLASIQLFQPAATGLSATNGLAPEVIRIGGNLSTVDDYVVQDILPPSSGSCSGQRIYLAIDSPSMYRINAAANPTAAIQAVFQPVAGQNFGLRLYDLTTGKYTFHVVCAAGMAAGVGDGGAAQPYVDIANTPLILPATEGGPNGFGSGKVTVNPVQLVDWFLAPRDPAYSAIDLVDGGDPDEYDLYRQWVNMGNPPTRVGTPELIAEYAVDLKFSFTVDGRTTPPQAAAVSLTTLNYGDPVNVSAWAGPVNTSTAGSTPDHWPQRIRSVRVRLATRAAQPDRPGSLPGPDDASGFQYRYCVDAPACTRYARMRTVTTEVGLPNQSQLYYP